jgi:hypothetical protein
VSKSNKAFMLGVAVGIVAHYAYVNAQPLAVSGT